MSRAVRIAVLLLAAELCRAEWRIDLTETTDSPSPAATSSSKRNFYRVSSEAASAPFQPISELKHELRTVEKGRTLSQAQQQPEQQYQQHPQQPRRKRQQQKQRRRRESYSRTKLLAAYPHVYPGCRGLLHLLEGSPEGRSELQHLHAPLQRLQYLQRTVRQYELDLDTLIQPPAERRWEPYISVGLQECPGTAAIATATANDIEAAAAAATAAIAANKSTTGTRPLLRTCERVLRSTSQMDLPLLKEELTRRLAAAASELDSLLSVTTQRLERLRGLLRNATSVVADTSAPTRGPQTSTSNGSAAAGGVPPARTASVEEENVESSATGRIGGGGSGGAAAGGRTVGALIAPDPGVLELYDLLLVPCTQSRLKPRNYISHPPRPRISLILPYSGRRLPYIVRHVVEPLLTCAAAAATTAGGNVTAAAAAAAAGPPMPLDFFELLVAFDDVHEAADWADISAESGGRVIPVFRPQYGSGGGDDGGGNDNGAGGAGGSGEGGGESPPVVSVSVLQRLAEMAVGEMLVVLRDGDGLSYDSYCSWLHHALQAFKAWPRLAVLGGPGFVPLDELDERQQMIVEAQRNQTTNRQLPLRFVVALTTTTTRTVDDRFTGRGGSSSSSSSSSGGKFTSGSSSGGGSSDGGSGLLAFRRTAWLDVGGVDAGLGAASLCGGGCGWLDLTLRMWLAGWQVAHMLPIAAGDSSSRGSQASARAARQNLDPDLDLGPEGNPDPESEMKGSSERAVAWCVRGPVAVLQEHRDAACMRVLQMRYGSSRSRSADSGSKSSGSASREAWFAGSALHSQISDMVRELTQLQLQRQRLHRPVFG